MLLSESRRDLTEAAFLNTADPLLDSAELLLRRDRPGMEVSEWTLVAVTARSVSISPVERNNSTDIRLYCCCIKKLEFRCNSASEHEHHSYLIENDLDSIGGGNVPGTATLSIANCDRGTVFEQ